jgi:hypothetical protein
LFVVNTVSEEGTWTFASYSAVMNIFTGLKEEIFLKEAFRAFDMKGAELFICPIFFILLFPSSIQTTYVFFGGSSLFGKARLKISICITKFLFLSVFIFTWPSAAGTFEEFKNGDLTAHPEKDSIAIDAIMVRKIIFEILSVFEVFIDSGIKF